jgi:hypothetical protein
MKDLLLELKEPRAENPVLTFLANNLEHSPVENFLKKN